MTSWRESASAEAQAEIEGLFDFQLNTATALLQKNREFYPIAATAAGENITPVAVYEGDEHPESAAVIGGLKDILRKTRGEFDAAAIAYDILVTVDGKKTSAVCVDLEHKDGICFRLITPYVFKGIINKRIGLGDTVMNACDKFVWSE
ncbi:MAG: hypothetical protein LBP26_03105 [Clostridiales bacterium]|jgi:hypothetical protein|nr:hypothetical protein [Clostridiales bacterium]